MSMNPNWTRWIHASLSKHFMDRAKQGSITLYIEATDKVLNEPQDWVEVRWDGPFADERLKDYWTLDIEINILVSSVVARDDTHKHKRVVGLVQAMYDSYLPVYRYGEDPSLDTGGLLGCLMLRGDNREAIITSYFGKIETDVALEQSVVEAHYRMNLKGNKHGSD